MDQLIPVYGPSLISVEKKRYAAVNKRDEIYTTQYKPMLQAVRDAGSKVWGYCRHKNGHFDKNYIRLFSIEKSIAYNGDAISVNFHPIGSPEAILTRPIEELPLLMGNSEALSKESLQALRDRCSGLVSSASPYRQDLIDLYDLIDKRSSVQYKIISECNGHIERYISHKIWHEHPKKMQLNASLLVILHINGRVYQWIPHQTEKLFHLPEYETIHIDESEILADEKKDPRIKGVQYMLSSQRPHKKGRAGRGSTITQPAVIAA